jgi:hypothetical protein
VFIPKNRLNDTQGEKILPVEKHDGAWVVELVHCIEIFNFFIIDLINYSKVPERVLDLEKHVVHFHAIRIIVFAEPDNYKFALFVHYCIVNLPAGHQLLDHISHFFLFSGKKKIY